jgi:hypothetical protein
MVRGEDRVQLSPETIARIADFLTDRLELLRSSAHSLAEEIVEIIAQDSHRSAASRDQAPDAARQRSDLHSV